VSAFFFLECVNGCEDCAAFPSSSFEFSLGCSFGARARFSFVCMGRQMYTWIRFRVGNFFFCLRLFRVYHFFCFEHPFFGSKKLQKRKARAHKHNTNTHNTRARTFISRKKKQVVHSALVVEYTRERTKRNNNTNYNKERCQRARRYKPQRWMWTRKRGRKM